MFGWNKKSMDTLNWSHLESEEQLQAAIEESHDRPVVLFKHSTRCSISFMALDRMNGESALNEKDAGLYYLDLLKFRNLSNKIEELFEIRHESPQMIVLRNGAVVHHSSHGAIRPATVLDLVA